MEEILFLTHRIPWPPNKGDKIRSHHMLRHLAERYRVHLGTFIDDVADEQHVPALHDICAGVYVSRLTPWRSRWRAAAGLLRGQALTLPCYADPGMRRWVDGLLAERPVRRAVVFSSAMAQYVEDAAGLRRVIDLVDVDSDKWSQYSQGQSWPWSWIYRREGRRLLQYERRLARRAEACVLVSDEEVDLFRRLAPESASVVRAMHNGVDTAYFDPAAAGESPYPRGETPLVFTGAMDYWPNVDAVCWFVDEVLPRILENHPSARFYIVGNRPAPRVRALARRPGVVVTGFVEDMRPWLAHSRVAVAPLRIARGVQNKVLEAMAMGRPMVASPQALAGIRARTRAEVPCAASADAFVCMVGALLECPDPASGVRLRRRVVTDYSWRTQLKVLDELLPPPAAKQCAVSAETLAPVMEAAHGN